MSATYALKYVQRIPCSLDEAWRFFSDPANLVRITPESFSFRIISQHHGDTMYPGQVIEYKVKPVLGIPLYWMTEITHVVDRKLFVDEQRYGPYSLWHHQHLFREIEGGVEMTDIVHYRIPLGWLGDMGNALFVRKKLKQVFDYRFEQVEKLFGKWK